MGVIWMRIIDGIMSQSSKLFGMCGGSVEVKVGVLKGMFIHAFKDVDLKGI